MAIALYARKSIERENSISCETQIEYCKSVIKPDERSEKTIEFIDNGYSGGNVDRDGFQKMTVSAEVFRILWVFWKHSKNIMFSLFPLKNPSTRQVRTVK